MKKHKFLKVVLVIFAIIVAICVSIAVFVHSSAESAKAPVLEVSSPTFVGTWELDSATKNGEDKMSDYLKVIRSLHMSRYLTLSEDGSVILEALGSKLKGTWNEDSVPVSMVLELSKFEDVGFVDEWQLLLEGDTLVVTGGDWELRFFRIDAKDKQNETVDLRNLGPVKNLLEEHGVEV